MQWNGNNIGKQVCDGMFKWGRSRTITTLQSSGTYIVRTIDDLRIASIADELSGLFGLYKTGTVTMNCRGYLYTCYSFMCGEQPYKIGQDYELDEMVLRWKIYYGWWNVDLLDGDFYVRKYMNKDVIVVYPSCAWRSSDIIASGTYKVELPSTAFGRSNRDVLNAWLGCYSDQDLIVFLNKTRDSILSIIDRINPECIHISNIILSRIKTFLFYDTEEK